MARDNKRKGRGCLVTLLILIILGLLVWFVGLPLANNKVEDIVDTSIQDAISAPGMPKMSYGDIQINAQQGRVELFNIDLPLEEGSTIKAGSIRLKVAPTELVAFGLGRSEGLSKAEIALSDFSYENPETAVTFGRADIVLDGLINLNDVESSVVRNAKINANQVRYTDPVSKMAFNTAAIALDLKGNLTMATLEKDLDGILDDIAYIDVEATEGTFQPDDEMLSQIGMFAMVSPWIADTNNWGFDSMALQARSLEDSVVMDGFSLKAPLMDAQGTATLPRGKEGPLALDMDVSELNSQVRSELAPLAMYMGYAIPEDDFNLSVDWTGEGMPSIVFR